MLKEGLYRPSLALMVVSRKFGNEILFTSLAGKFLNAACGCAAKIRR